jgi:hypothetical protein
MNKLLTKLAAIILFVFTVIQGCALPNEPCVRKDISSMAPLKAARYISPDIRRYSLGKGVAILVGTAVIHPFIGIVALSIYHDANKVPSDQGIPDYGKLVMDKFIERAKNEIPNWPIMNIEEKPIWEALKDNSNYILEFKIDSLEIDDSTGVKFITIVTMRDKEDNVVWEKGYKYSSEQFKHNVNYEQLKKDDYQLLKQEMIFAANATVDDFIQHFKNPQLVSVKNTDQNF